ncbi:hypothetical protein GCM10022409_34560 [Hymenobacter glaciei]|uniref:Low affinity iron permease family protein n=1 Tax=Hymenobacter glaciei TaxID=877209 RepID=A0ABP7UKA4_9BACT
MAESITKFSGSTAAFLAAAGIVLVWALTGPLFHYSETWQLVINTGTTIVTFLMVFLIQRAQNKDSLVLHLKLNELLAATQGASNRLINAQDFSEEEIRPYTIFTVRWPNWPRKTATSAKPTAWRKPKPTKLTR